jgi:phosphoribosylaminoimidazole-succinocarboxamide synthase
MPESDAGFAVRLPLLEPPVAGLRRVHRGKVRDSYAVGDDALLLVASDRLSAFDRVLPNGVPAKGAVLTQLSAFWFALTRDLVPNHLISAHWSEIAQRAGMDPAQTVLAGRSMLVRRAQRIDVECVVRGYLAGSGWEEYRAHGTLAGRPLPAGLQEAGALPEPAFTPAVKNEQGHDQNISVARLITLIGPDLARRLERVSRALYTFAHQHALLRGMIIADTKFEFGLCEGDLMLIDEALTPDSSRFWDAGAYAPGGPQASFDKQPVRDYLSGVGWRGDGPPPAVPVEVVEATAVRYRTAFERLTGQPFDV